MSLPKYRFHGKFTSYSSWSEQKQMLQKGRVWGSLGKKRRETSDTDGSAPKSWMSDFADLSTDTN